MLWLCICLPRLPLESLGRAAHDTPHVVTFTSGRSKRIVLADGEAERFGLGTGMDYATAEAAHPNLRAIERNGQAERAALERLATWAYQWSSFVTFQPADPRTLEELSLLWLEVGGSCNLFGGRERLLSLLEASLNDLAYTYRLGISYTLEGAALLARAGKRVLTITEPALRRQAENLPIAFLALPSAVIQALQKSGVRHVGAVLNLPADAIARRFDPETACYLDRLLGRRPDPRPAFELPKRYLGRCCLGADVDNTHALLFPIRRLLSEFQGYLRAIDAGIQQLSLLFEHHKRASTRIDIGAATPTRDAERLFALTRERLENFSLPAPVQEVHLQAERFTPAAAAQDDFFKGAATHEEHLQQVLEKISARLGPEAVRSVSLVADHRPELAWKYAAGSALSSAGASAKTYAHPPPPAAPRPLWLLSEPCRIEAPEHAVGIPERIESRWSQDPPTARDYYLARAHDGAQLWVYRDGADDRWYLHGLWS